MINCDSQPNGGIITVSGETPNGDAIIVREVDGAAPYLLRGGATEIVTGGFVLDDTEAPFGVDLTYRATITDIPDAERIIQQNLMPTPTFAHGVQGWVAGTGRTMTVEADPTAHTAAAVAKVTGNGGGVPPLAPPTLIGHVDSTVFTSTSYTLTPPTGGGTAIATNDWMLIVHQQLDAVAIPTTPSGWTVIRNVSNGTIRQVIYKRKRVGGDTGYTVVALAGSLSIGTLLWVRGAIDEIVVTNPGNPMTPGTSLELTNTVTTVLRPHLTLSFLNAGLSDAVAPPSGVGDVLGGPVWQYTLGSGTDPRSLTVAAMSNVEGGQTVPATAVYLAPLASGIAVSVVFQSTNDITQRIIAKGKTATLPVATEPYLLTGRFKFSSAGLTLWSDVLAMGTWADVKAGVADWQALRGVASSVVPADYLKLFLTIVNPADQTDYITPAQVIGTGETAVGAWIDFSALFVAPAGGIPSTAEVRLSHGASTKEYAIIWHLDEFGITPGQQRADNDTLYWFSGDTPVPADATARMLPGGTWVATTSDASITWAGTVGNSTSTFRGPSGVEATTMCILGAAENLEMPCEPVYLSDPVNASLGQWVGLLSIGNLSYPSRQAIHQIIGRAPSVAISQVRGWATGELVVLTNTLEQRAQLLLVLQSGRILLLRAPSPEWPETDWYLAIGDVEESRPIPMQRNPTRIWTLPFVRVERPTGLIEAATGTTWQQVKDMGTWAVVRDTREDWMDVILGDPVAP